MDWHSFLILGHIIGAIFGVGGSTMAEIFTIKSLKDGVVDETESRFLKITYFFIRVGLIILVLSGFGFLLLFRLAGISPEMIYTDRFLAKLAIILIIIFNPLLMQAKIIPYYVGGPVSLVSWYAVLIVSVARGLSVSFLTIMAVYLLAAVLAVLAAKTYFHGSNSKV